MSSNTESSLQEWNTVISPSRKWLDLRLFEVWQQRHLIYQFVRRDFRSSYKQTILGPLWFILPPIVNTLINVIIFGKFLNVSTDGAPQFLFFMIGSVVWSYFASSVTKSSYTFQGGAGIFGKVYFARLTVPVSAIILNLLTFLIQFAMFLAFYLYYVFVKHSVTPHWEILLLPLLLLQLAALGLGVGCIVTALTTKYRDLALIINYGIQLWMYASCVVYPLSVVPEQYRAILVLNPIVPVMETFRYAFFGESGIQGWEVAVGFASTAVILFLGLLIFNRSEKNFMDTV